MVLFQRSSKTYNNEHSWKLINTNNPNLTQFNPSLSQFNPNQFNLNPNEFNPNHGQLNPYFYNTPYPTRFSHLSTQRLPIAHPYSLYPSITKATPDLHSSPSKLGYPSLAIQLPCTTPCHTHISLPVSRARVLIPSEMLPETPWWIQPGPNLPCQATEHVIGQPGQHSSPIAAN